MYLNFKRPMIGVTGPSRGGVFMWRCVALGIWLGGGKPVHIVSNISQRDPSWYKQCSGFMIAGGADINPVLYGQTNTASINIDNERDALEYEIISYALNTGKPLAGICRGAQIINVVAGGTLLQNARDIFKEFLPTTSLLGKVFSRRKILITGNGLIASIFGLDALRVNSIHHQAIDVLGAGLKITAKDTYGIIQAIESNDSQRQYILAVQWHPEFMLYKKKHRQYFRKFVGACEKHNIN